MYIRRTAPSSTARSSAASPSRSSSARVASSNPNPNPNPNPNSNPNPNPNRGREGEGGVDGGGAVGGEDLHVRVVVAGDLAHDRRVGLETELGHHERARRELVRGRQAAQRAARRDREGVGDVWPAATPEHDDAPRLSVQTARAASQGRSETASAALSAAYGQPAPRPAPVPRLGPSRRRPAEIPF